MAVKKSELLERKKDKAKLTYLTCPQPFQGNDAQLLSMFEATGIGAGRFDTKRLQNMLVPTSKR